MSNKEQLLSSQQKKRLFFALWLDDKVVQKIKQHVIKHFSNCQGRILERNNWHITLAYFGAADVTTQACLEEQAEKIKSQPFELNLSKCGFWPRPKVAWLAPEEIPEALKVLTHELQHVIKPCGFEPETREFNPHLTLVRKAKHKPAVSEVEPINWQVRRFCLVESKTYPEGAQYKVLRSWDL
ncbi:MAG: RNA 2',3'-cyclic phosphodiesterase [Gammaproteobacteria bacterium]|nr:RNA 2',3'-cyclic phosphodiesterase [Gammaproteobacteria bacterium]